MRQEVKQYLTGFVVCLLLTVSAYLLVTSFTQPSQQLNMTVLIVLTVLALLQFIIQSIYFLHIKNDKSGRWHLAAFLSMLSVVLIIVVGSIWIMYNLNYNMHHQPSGEEAEQFIIKDEGFDHTH